MLSCSRRGQIYSQWKCEVKKLEIWHRNIGKKDLSQLTDTELLRLWEGYHKDYINFWIKGTVPELANYGADRVLEMQLKTHRMNSEEVQSVIETLTAPVQPSFYQEEEMALAAEKDIAHHQKRFFWLKNSYAGTQILPVSLFEQRKKEIPSTMRTIVHDRIKDLIKKKRDVQKTYSLSDELMETAHAISNGIAWQDERKKYIFIALHYQDVMLTEISRRSEYTMDDLHNAWFWEITEIIKGKDCHSILEKRRTGFGVDFFKKYRILDAQKTEEYWTLYTKEKIGLVHEVKGLVVSKGAKSKVVGCVHIVLDPSKVGEFKKGDILLAPMTSPEYIFAMKNASAIVTDAGGLTSHAAIVSRELNVPCIVGTKSATQVFKDGDVVEIDVNLGIVKKV